MNELPTLQKKGLTTTVSACKHIKTKVVKVTDDQYKVVCKCGAITGVIRNTTPTHSPKETEHLQTSNPTINTYLKETTDKQLTNEKLTINTETVSDCKEGV